MITRMKQINITVSILLMYIWHITCEVHPIRHSLINIVSVNGSLCNGGCTTLENNMICSLQDGGTSVLVDGTILPLSGLDGNQWARDLFTVNKTGQIGSVIGFDFDGLVNVRRLELVLFNCNQLQIASRAITVHGTSSAVDFPLTRDRIISRSTPSPVVNVGSIQLNSGVDSCDNLLRVCISISFPTQVYYVEFYSPTSSWVVLAEAAFYTDSPPCNATPIPVTSSLTPDFSSISMPIPVQCVSTSTPDPAPTNVSTSTPNPAAYVSTSMLDLAENVSTSTPHPAANVSTSTPDSANESRYTPTTAQTNVSISTFVPTTKFNVSTFMPVPTPTNASTSMPVSAPNVSTPIPYHPVPNVSTSTPTPVKNGSISMPASAPRNVSAYKSISAPIPTNMSTSMHAPVPNVSTSTPTSVVANLSASIPIQNTLPNTTISISITVGSAILLTCLATIMLLAIVSVIVVRKRLKNSVKIKACPLTDTLTTNQIQLSQHTSQLKASPLEENDTEIDAEPHGQYDIPITINSHVNPIGSTALVNETSDNVPDMKTTSVTPTPPVAEGMYSVVQKKPKVDKTCTVDGPEDTSKVPVDQLYSVVKKKSKKTNADVQSSDNDEDVPPPIPPHTVEEMYSVVQKKPKDGDDQTAVKDRDTPPPIPPHTVEEMYSVVKKKSKE